MIGDSLTWRGSDELARLRPSFVLDGEPARRPTELRPRLSFFRSLHGQPDGLVIELGAVPARGFSRQDLAKAVGSVPRKTRVIFVLPYYEARTNGRTGSHASGPTAEMSVAQLRAEVPST